MGSAARERSGVLTGAAAATTTTKTTVWCGGCDAWYGADVVRSIDASRDVGLVEAFLREGFAGIGRVACPACGTAYVIEEPFTLHDPAARRLVLVLPAGQRHRAQQHRAELIRAVAEEPGDVVPPYALEPELVVGAEGLADRLNRREAEPSRDGGDVSSAADAVVEPPGHRPSPVETDPAVEAEVSIEVESETSAVPDDGGAGPVEVGPASPEVRIEPPTDPSTASLDVELSVDVPVSVEAGGAAAAAAPRDAGDDVAQRAPLLAEALEGAAEPPSPVPAERTGDGWDASLDAAWSLEDVEGPAGPAEDPTHVVKADEVAGPRRPAGPAFDAARAGGRDGYLAGAGGHVQAVVRIDPARARAFEDGEVGLWFQLHGLPTGPVMDLLLVRFEQQEGPPDVVDHVCWVIEHETPDHQKVLELLASDFDVEVLFHAPDGAFHGRRRFRLPLEQNVRAARAAAEEIERKAGEDLDPVAARGAFLADDYDRVGRLRHNFHEDSFVHLRSAAEARLALGILSYWSAPERRDYLLRIRSFPQVWFEGLTRRVLEAAVYFGLAMEPHLRQRALDLGLAESSSALLRQSLANFAEVNLNLRLNELDPLDAWENWEALLAHAEELEVRVDEEIEELAALAMERARAAATQTPVSEPAEINADVESVELVEVADLSELSPDDLLALLDDRAHRVEAALGLLSRAEGVYAPAVFDAIKVMTPDELLRVVPAALAVGPSFEASFLGGLRSRRACLRLASALFLAEIRSERGVGPLLDVLAGANEAEWPILARAAARMGRRILGPAIERVAAEGDPAGRIATTLALLGPEARGALAAARDNATDEAVRRCLAAALEQTGEVSFGDAADFTERLADAFRVAGPDDLGPDFEEDLVSVDLGPGASIESVEAEMDLDDLDEPGGSDRRR